MEAVEFIPEITDDCLKSEIPHRTMDFLINYEDGLIDLEQLKDCEHRFVALEFYCLAESVKRALKAIYIIFKQK